MENINIKPSKLLKIMLDGESQESNVNVLSRLNFYHNKFKNQDFKNKLKKVKNIRNKIYGHYDNNIAKNKGLDTLFAVNKLLFKDIKDISFEMI